MNNDPPPPVFDAAARTKLSHARNAVLHCKASWKELKASSFKRSFTLGDLLDGDNISANFKDGILSISIPKIEPKQPKVTNVKIK